MTNNSIGQGLFNALNVWVPPERIARFDNRVSEKLQQLLEAIFDEAMHPYRLTPAEEAELNEMKRRTIPRTNRKTFAQFREECERVLEDYVYE